MARQSKAAGKTRPKEVEEIRASDPLPSSRRVLVRKLDRRSLYQPQGPDSGINAIIGRWPGDESEEEILALLEDLS